MIIYSWYPREIDTVIAWHDMTSLLSWGAPTLLLVPETRAFAWNNLNIIQTKLPIHFFLFTNTSWNDAVMIWHTVHRSRYSRYNSSWHSKYSLYRKKTIYHFEDRHSIYMCEHFQAIPIFFHSSASICNFKKLFWATAVWSFHITYR